ncbi:hypothetical protein B0H17DRAFT_1143844 [Mycena rosella]|uniref:Uncharacterized protein n=1 Tax=Mycena rosella TaxID=1033263 RepID=A0AAD7CU29_MYCRO|nr:hypothetical protein B0H17DRAFT_1143844 [Mycena rosella]
MTQLAATSYTLLHLNPQGDLRPDIGMFLKLGRVDPPWFSEGMYLRAKLQLQSLRETAAVPARDATTTTPQQRQMGRRKFLIYPTGVLPGRRRGFRTDGRWSDESRRGRAWGLYSDSIGRGRSANKTKTKTNHATLRGIVRLNAGRISCDRRPTEETPG